MIESKLTERLVKKLGESSGGDLVELIIELEQMESFSAPSTQSRAERIIALRSAFEEVTKPIERGIEAAGGETVDHAWINQTIKARVPKSAVSFISDWHSVRRLDLTNLIEPEE